MTQATQIDFIKKFKVPDVEEFPVDDVTWKEALSYFKIKWRP